MTDLLKLSGKDLEKELDRIAEENRPYQKRWMPREEEILRKLYLKGVSATKIAALLGRTQSSVRNKIENSRLSQR